MQDEMKVINDEYVKKVKDAGIHEGETEIANLKVGADEILKLKEEAKDFQRKIQTVQVEHNKLYREFEPLSKEVHTLHDDGKKKSDQLQATQQKFETRQKTANEHIATLEAFQENMKAKHVIYMGLKDKITALKDAAEKETK